MLCVPPPALAKQTLSWANKTYELVDICSNTLYLDYVSSSLWCAAEEQLCLGKSPSEGEIFMLGISKLIAAGARWEQRVLGVSSLGCGGMNGVPGRRIHPSVCPV